MHDPLGIEALITRKRQEIDGFIQPADTWQTWLAHPITKHLMSTIQMDIYQRQINSAASPNPELVNQLQAYLSFGEAQSND